jgi:dipeptidyl aminopeptidase/acylaminoacyl peptidase
MKQLCASAMFLVLGSSASGQPVRRPITESDLLEFRWIADPQISPDGREVAYVLVTANEKEDRYDTSIWAVASSRETAPRPLSSGPRDTAPRWSPDSRTLAFLRAGEKDPPQIHLLSMSGGEARKLTDMPKGASPALWSPDGRTIAFTSRATPEDFEEQKKNAGRPEAEKDAERKKSDVRIVTRAVYRDDGAGMLDPKAHEHIWTVPSEVPRDGAAAATQITAGRYDEQPAAWSPDGSRIYFASDRVDEPYYRRQDGDLYSVPAAGGALQTVIDVDGPVLGAASSPDGRAFAYLGWLNSGPEPSYVEPDAFVFRNGKAEGLTADYDADVGNAIVGDQRPPRGGGVANPLVWAADGSALIVSTTEHGRANLMRIDVASRRIEPLTTGDHEVVAYSATPAAARMALTLQDGTHLTELYLLDTASRRLTRLTHENDALLDSLELALPERITWSSFDGTKIEAWVVKPPRFDLRKKYPLILNIHGGPHIAYGETFFHEFQWMAAKGYVVLAPNPRGSSSYGQEFGNSIQYKYPGDDYQDLMAGVDELVRRGYIDEKRLGVTGGSGGGLLTNWTITQTSRYRAAVSQRSLADWGAFWYATDFTLFTPFWFRKYPFQDPEEYRQRSPLTYVERITTPLMLIEGERDLRSPTDTGGGMMFRALKALHKPAVMVLFPDETHELSRSGKPSHRIERLRHILNWFDKHLLGRTMAEYDLQ